MTLPFAPPASQPGAALRAARHGARRAQRGVTLFGLVFWAVVIGFIGYVAVRVLPTLNEYITVQRMVDTVAASNPSTVAAARVAFDRQLQIEYSVSAITGADLEITKEDDKVVIAYAYQKEVPLGGPVYILLKYEGRSK
jgi:hypothetical protein